MKKKGEDIYEVLFVYRFTFVCVCVCVRWAITTTIGFKNL